MIAEKQKALLQHMLGADSRYLKKEWGFRNHFCAGGEGDPDRVELERMEEAGLVTSGVRLDSKTFWATKAGAIAIGFKSYQLSKACLVQQPKERGK